jgi:hypothetical protein
MSESRPQSHIAHRSATVRPETRRKVLVAAVALSVFALSFLLNLAAVSESQFHPDESRWLNRSYYLRELFHPLSDVWEDRYLTRGQPPMGSYVTGLGLLLQGRDLPTNGPWDFHYGNESTVTWNMVKGNMPSPADFVAARRTSAVVGALTCLVLFLIVTQLTNWVGGAIAGVFLAFHPLAIYLASIAVSDAVFTLFVACSILAAIALATKPSWSRTIVLGVILGFGTSTKLSPIVVAIILAGLGGVILLDGLLRRVPLLGRLWSWWSRVDRGSNRRLGWMLISLPGIALAVFVLSYPYLWPDPIGRGQYLIDFRRNEMDNQARIWPQSSVDSRVEALRRTWRNLEYQYDTSGRLFGQIGGWLGRDWTGWGADLPLALAGLVVFAWLALRHGFPSRWTLALAVLGMQSAAILGGLRVDFNRYYLPFVLASAIGVGILAGQLWATASTLARRRAPVIHRSPFNLRQARLRTGHGMTPRQSPTAKR